MLSLFLLVIACFPNDDPADISLNKEIDLPVILNENSGMIIFNNLIWFINDGGNDPVLYSYSRDLKEITRKVVVKDCENVDWEEISQNDSYIYIGDFGNNSGSRKDLKIIRILKSDLLNAEDTVKHSGIIEFSYENQNDFTPHNELTSFDCEAFVVTDNLIILFTKDWINKRTQLYTIPNSPGKYSAEYQSEWNTEGLITSAYLSCSNNNLYLLGYTPIVPFLLIYSDFNEINFSYSSIKRIEFSGNFGIQTEGILTDDGKLLISSEKNYYPASLYYLVEE